MSEILGVAVEAARAAGEVLVERFRGPAVDVRTKSSATDPVSEADVLAEQAVRAVLAARRPGDAVLGEEGGEERLPGEGDGEPLRWVVDPLDGTVNFLFGIPAWAVSVACADADGTVAGVVLDPLRGEAFTAERGGPALLDGVPLRGSERTELATALVATGFAYDPAVRARQGEVVAALLPRVRDVRRVGAAALDLAWLAAGRFDAFYERGLNAWDSAAGLLLCERAGLDVRPLPAAGGLPAGVLAAPSAIADGLAALVG